MLMKPMEGDLYGYWSGISTCTLQTPPVNGATDNKHSAAARRTVLGSMEADMEFLHVVIDKRYGIVAHESTATVSGKGTAVV